MYTPPHFEETRIEVLHELILSQPLATLVAYSSNSISANHIPLHLQESRGSIGTLEGHIARTNPLWQELNSGSEVLTIFHGPQFYISPSWYETKKETQKVVPTWNFCVVHAQGSINFISDPEKIMKQITRFTDIQESRSKEPWKVSDAPEDFVHSRLEHIVGIEIELTKLTGKWKVSQNQPQKNKDSVIRNLSDQNLENADAMVNLIREGSN